jgi:GAF domain-containing protein
MAKGQDEVAALKRIIEITGALNSTLNVDELLELIMSSAAELLGAETSSLLLLDEESGDLVIHIATGEPGEAVERRHVPPVRASRARCWRAASRPSSRMRRAIRASTG